MRVLCQIGGKRKVYCTHYAFSSSDQCYICSSLSFPGFSTEEGPETLASLHRDKEGAIRYALASMHAHSRNAASTNGPDSRPTRVILKTMAGAWSGLV